ncbi:xanthine dehydrogenase FAD-binding subunit XdhB [Ruminococcaceae bacterium OttesenSCG-928-I18]|nr:xanthine dehydrogenase FAD-binding subunit XdhB [Ruminococcaceae bacterium OttesenSCG-928-I18]
MYDFGTIYEAKGIPDAITALMADENAVVLCGGSDVLLRVREGRLAGRNLVSIRSIDDLSGILQENNETIQIRPATTFAQITQNELVQRCIPTLGEAVDQIGGPQLRNVATVGGNLCNGACSADSPPVLLTLNAELEITGPNGARRLLLEDFFEGPGKVNLEHGELLTAIRVAKKDYEGYFGHYIKFSQREAMDIATLGCAVQVKLGAEGKTIEDARLAFAVAAPVPMRCHAAEESIRGQAVGETLYDWFGRTALTEVRPRTSWRASETFRRQLIYELSGRALKAAIQKAKGEGSA